MEYPTPLAAPDAATSAGAIADDPGAPHPSAIPPRDWPFGRAPKIETDFTNYLGIDSAEDMPATYFAPGGGGGLVRFSAPLDYGGDCPHTWDTTHASIEEDGLSFSYNAGASRLQVGAEYELEFIDDVRQHISAPADLKGHRVRIRIDYNSATFGVYGTFVGEFPHVDHRCRREASESVRAWIADALGDSEFRWDTLAVHRSMLRYMKAALFGDDAPRATFTNALLRHSGVEIGKRSIAAAMAQFDGLGKRLSHDYALSRPEILHDTDPLRLIVYPHLLVCMGTFLSNYKRRFVIQNALGLDTETKLALHRELIVGDTTDEGNRAVWIDWARADGGRNAASMTTARWLRNSRSVEWSEQFDAGMRLWKVLARPTEGEYCAFRDAALLAAESRAVLREAAMYGHHALAIQNGDDSPKARFLAERLLNKPTWLRAHCNETGAEFPSVDDASAWSGAYHLLLEQPRETARDWFSYPWPGTPEGVRDAILESELLCVEERFKDLSDPAED